MNRGKKTTIKNLGNVFVVSSQVFLHHLKGDGVAVKAGVMIRLGVGEETMLTAALTHSNLGFSEEIVLGDLAIVSSDDSVAEDDADGA